MGGAAKALVVGEVAAQIFNTAVTAPRPDEYVALGAALQAAWALRGTPRPPEWTAAHGGASRLDAAVSVRRCGSTASSIRLGSRTPW
ncbi:FGGY-family carbohydrate kinase [Streptomyces sp. NPDC002851]